MDSLWDYDAPQYVDFNNVDDDPAADEYFDVDHEIGEPTLLMDEEQEELANASVKIDIEKKSIVETKNVENLDVHGTPTDAEMSTYEDAVNTPAIVKMSVMKHDSVQRSASNTPVDVALIQQNSTSQKTRKRTVPAVQGSASRIPMRAMTPASANDNKRIKLSVNTDTAKEPAMQKGKTLLGSNTMKSILASKSEAISQSKSSTAEKKNDKHTTNEGFMRRVTSNSSSSSGHIRQSSADHRISPAIDGCALRRRSQSQSNVSESPVVGRQTRANAGAVKITIPQTPLFMRRELKAVRSNVIKSSEVLEMDKIRVLRNELVQKRKIAAESCAKALVPVRCEPVHANLPLTHPKEFNFATDTRVKGIDAGDGKGHLDAVWKEVHFVSELRKHTNAPITTMPGRTVPQPFHLHEGNKRKLSTSDEKFETVAEKVVKFCTKTPDRFRTKPRSLSRERNLSGERAKSEDREPMKLTIAKTPNLMTRGRARSVTVVSQADIEEQEFEEMKKHQFKARPLNKKIFANLHTGIRKVEPKGCTVPEEFDLEIEKRLHARKEQEQAIAALHLEQPFEFHARPVPEAILQGTVGVKPAKELPLTIPQSPAFVSKYLLRSTKSTQQEEEPQMFKAHPIPHSGIVFHPRLQRHTTTIEPFSFEERMSATKLKREQLIEEKLKEEMKMREFHANPLKELEPVLPPKKVKPVTKPEPFQLLVDKRAVLKEIDFTHKIQEQVQQQKAAARFRAKSADVLKKAPYAPLKCTKPLTEVSRFQLNTEKRMEERQEWEKWKNEQETEAAAERMARLKRQAEAEESALRKQREEAVHHANPIRTCKPIEILPSTAPLTVPITPAFSERLRVRSKPH